MKNKHVEIVYEDKDILVCIKPAGMATQSRRFDVPDLESILRNHVATHGGKSDYLAVIHRLDQPVQGLLVFAKTPAAARNLNKQLATRGFSKHYQAVLEGIPSVLDGTLENHLLHDAKSNLSRACPAGTPGARLARLHYRVLRTEGERCSVEITLDTGRHHQIRAQMSSLGCPIVGDVKYGAKPSKPGCIALYACRLKFRHPSTDKPMCFEFPIEPSEQTSAENLL